MTRPRRPAQRKTVKRGMKSKKPALSITAIQAEVFEVPKPPMQLAYQWSPVEDLLDMQDAGWIAVPFERHKEQLSARKYCAKRRLVDGVNIEGYIVAFGQMLFQREAVLVDAQRDIAHRAARKNLDDHVCNTMHRREGGFVRIVDASFMVSSDYGRVDPDAGPIDVDLTIKFRVPARWQDAAAALQLDPTEYARRRLLMEPSVIATSALSPDVYEYVELSVSRKD